MDDQPQNWITDELSRVAASERAPERVRLRVAALKGRDVPAIAPPPALTVPRSWRGRAAGIGGGLVVALGVLAIVVLIALPANPTVAQAAQFGARRPNLPPPAPLPSAPNLYLRAGMGTLHFPNWTRTVGWRAYGGRNDDLVNQYVLTVYYRHRGLSVAYSIVSGAALSGQKPGYTSFTEHGRTVISWKLAGHSCLLSAANVSRNELLKLARSVYPDVPGARYVAPPRIT